MGDDPNFMFTNARFLEEFSNLVEYDEDRPPLYPHKERVFIDG